MNIMEDLIHKYLIMRHTSSNFREQNSQKVKEQQKQILYPVVGNRRLSKSQHCKIIIKKLKALHFIDRMNPDLRLVNYPQTDTAKVIHNFPQIPQTINRISKVPPKQQQIIKLTGYLNTILTVKEQDATLKDSLLKKLMQLSIQDNQTRDLLIKIVKKQTQSQTHKTQYIKTKNPQDPIRFNLSTHHLYSIEASHAATQAKHQLIEENVKLDTLVTEKKIHLDQLEKDKLVLEEVVTKKMESIQQNQKHIEKLKSEIQQFQKKISEYSHFQNALQSTQDVKQLSKTIKDYQEHICQFGESPKFTNIDIQTKCIFDSNKNFISEMSMLFQTVRLMHLRNEVFDPYKQVQFMHKVQVFVKQVINTYDSYVQLLLRSNQEKDAYIKKVEDVTKKYNFLKNGKKTITSKLKEEYSSLNYKIQEILKSSQKITPYQHSSFKTKQKAKQFKQKGSEIVRSNELFRKTVVKGRKQSVETQKSQTNNLQSNPFKSIRKQNRFSFKGSTPQKLSSHFQGIGIDKSTLKEYFAQTGNIFLLSNLFNE